MFDSKVLNPIILNELRKKISNFRNNDIKAQVFVPKDISSLQEFIREIYSAGQHFFPLGGGSNLLIGNAENDIFICDFALPKAINIKGNEVEISSNYNINVLLMKLLQHNLGGLEFLAGIPAHLGGIIKMNAGAYGHSISEFVKEVTIVDNVGKMRKLKAHELNFSYRNANIDGFIISAKLVLPNENHLSGKELITSYIENRREKQPLNYPNLGCFYKNPSKYSAGYLIDKCGLKGFCIGGACVSNKHANFIINKNDATFEDVQKLMQKIETDVFAKFKIKLEREIKVIGK